MGALPQARPSERTRKLPSRAPSAEQFPENYGRDPRLPCERLRKRTNWKSKRPAHAPLFFGALADLHRITNPTSRAEVLLLLHVIAESFGRFVEPGEAYQESTEALELTDLAQRCGTDVRTMQRLVVDLDQAGPDNRRGRGLMRVKREGQGKVVCTPLVKDWQRLPDYVEWLALNAPKPVVDAEDEPEQDDTATPGVVKGTVRLCKKPQTVKPGASKLLKIDCGVNEFQFTNPLAIDLTIDPVVQGGRLLCVPMVAEEAQRNKSEETNGINKLTSEKRHGCRVDSPEAPANGGSEVSPRRAEVIALFDPLLMRWGSSLLVGDPKALQKACAELGEMPREFLTHFILNPKGRGSRSISGPLAVAAIVADARLLWEKQEQTAREFERKNAGKRADYEARQRRQHIENAKKILASDSSFWTEEDREFARETLAAEERES